MAALTQSSGGSFNGLRESSEHTPPLPLTVTSGGGPATADLRLLRPAVGSTERGEGDVVDSAEAGEEAAEPPGAVSELAGWTWLTLEPAAGISLPPRRAESCGLSVEWAAGEPDVEVGVRPGLWWLAAVEPLPCGVALSLVRGVPGGTPEVAVCEEEEAGDDVEEGEGEDR